MDDYRIKILEFIKKQHDIINLAALKQDLNIDKNNILSFIYELYIRGLLNKKGMNDYEKTEDFNNLKVTFTDDKELFKKIYELKKPEDKFKLFWVFSYLSNKKFQLELGKYKVDASLLIHSLTSALISKYLFTLLKNEISNFNEDMVFYGALLHDINKYKYQVDINEILNEVAPSLNNEEKKLITALILYHDTPSLPLGNFSHKFMPIIYIIRTADLLASYSNIDEAIQSLRIGETEHKVYNDALKYILSRIKFSYIKFYSYNHPLLSTLFINKILKLLEQEKYVPLVVFYNGIILGSKKNTENLYINMDRLLEELWDEIKNVVYLDKSDNKLLVGKDLGLINKTSNSKKPYTNVGAMPLVEYFITKESLPDALYEIKGRTMHGAKNDKDTIKKIERLAKRLAYAFYQLNIPIDLINKFNVDVSKLPKMGAYYEIFMDILNRNIQELINANLLTNQDYLKNILDAKVKLIDARSKDGKLKGDELLIEICKKLVEPIDINVLEKNKNDLINMLKEFIVEFFESDLLNYTETRLPENIVEEKCVMCGRRTKLKEAIKAIFEPEQVRVFTNIYEAGKNLGTLKVCYACILEALIKKIVGTSYSFITIEPLPSLHPEILTIITNMVFYLIDDYEKILFQILSVENENQIYDLIFDKIASLSFTDLSLPAIYTRVGPNYLVIPSPIDKEDKENDTNYILRHIFLLSLFAISTGLKVSFNIKSLLETRDYTVCMEISLPLAHSYFSKCKRNHLQTFFIDSIILEYFSRLLKKTYKASNYIEISSIINDVYRKFGKDRREIVLSSIFSLLERRLSNFNFINLKKDMPILINLIK